MCSRVAFCPRCRCPGRSEAKTSRATPMYLEVCPLVLRGVWCEQQTCLHQAAQGGWHPPSPPPSPAIPAMCEGGSWGGRVGRGEMDVGVYASGSPTLRQASPQASPPGTVQYDPFAGHATGRRQNYEATWRDTLDPRQKVGTDVYRQTRHCDVWTDTSSRWPLVSRSYSIYSAAQGSGLQQTEPRLGLISARGQLLESLAGTGAR